MTELIKGARRPLLANRGCHNLRSVTSFCVPFKNITNSNEMCIPELNHKPVFLFVSSLINTFMFAIIKNKQSKIVFL